MKNKHTNENNSKILKIKPTDPHWRQQPFFRQRWRIVYLVDQWYFVVRILCYYVLSDYCSKILLHKAVEFDYNFVFAQRTWPHRHRPHNRFVMGVTLSYCHILQILKFDANLFAQPHWTKEIIFWQGYVNYQCWRHSIYWFLHYTYVILHFTFILNYLTLPCWVHRRTWICNCHRMPQRTHSQSEHSMKRSANNFACLF